ncbi:MAG: hypothetical protein V1773_04480 [bacterium]
MKILNMNAIIVLFFFILFFKNNYAQDEKTENDSTYIIELKEFYDGKGVVFGIDEKYYGSRDSTDQRISLSLADVIEAEKVLDSLVNLYYRNDLNSKKEHNSKLRGYYRQYWGYKNIFNEKKIIMFIFNFNDPDSIEYFNDGWDKGFCIGTHDLYLNNTRIYIINLTKREMENGSWPLKLK